jgi:Carboxypeptidase regulatory-like domain/TonB dependent receptor-like, beta-barrel/TonB-dependent Receptor Plug Domain
MQSEFRLNKLHLLALLALLFAAAFAMAQGIVTGSISGTVEDAQGAIVTNAKITAKEVATNREYSGETSSSGSFTLRALPPGTYIVTIDSPNFRKYENKAVVVSVGSAADLGHVKMEIGSASETVTVEGTAPLIETTTQQITATFDSRKAQDLPVGNTLDSLALFVPGVATAGDAAFSNNNGAEIAVNGQRSRSNNYQIDGQNNNDNSVGGPSIFFGNQDAVAELQVVTNYSAEYGRNMGAVVNYITKSGTNSFHGSAYEAYNGSTFDSLRNESKSALFNGPGSLPWCQKGQNPDTDGCDRVFVPRVVDNRFGGTIGGPIIKDKVWFFGSAHFQRQRFGAAPSDSGGAVLPTETGIQQLQAAFPGNSAVAALANIGPTAVSQGNPTFGHTETRTVSDGATSADVEFGTISRFIPSLYNDYEATGRVDVKVTNKDNFFGRYVFQQNVSTGVAGANGIAVGDFVDVPGRSQQIGLEWDRYWTNTFTNSARFSFSRAGFGFEGGAFPSCTRPNILNCPSNIAFGDDTANFGLSTNLPQGRIINVYQVQDNASWQVGKMTIKMGGEYSKQRSPNVFLPLINGQYVYDDFNEFLAGGNPDPATAGPGPLFASLSFGNPKLPFVEHDVAFYVQNDWRIKDNLTLNIGVRWEFFQQAINLLHDRTVASQAGPNPLWDTSLPLSQTTVPHIPQDLNNFSPVVGFAWTPRIMRGIMGDDKTVIRGGFRIGYDPSFYNMFLNSATRAPVVNSATLGFGAGVQVPGIPASGLGPDVRADLLPNMPIGAGQDPGRRSQTQVGRNFHNPYAQQWNLGIQRSLGQRVVAEVRYVGNHDVGNFQNLNGNPRVDFLAADFPNAIPAGIAPCSTPGTPGAGVYVNCNNRRVILRANSAFSTYHGLQTELRMANYHGITATAAYTYSRVMDNASEVYSTGIGGNTLSFAQDPFNTGKGEKAVSGYDYPHIFGLTFIYDLPFYKSQHGIAGKVLGGWQLNSTYRYTSGQPTTIVQSIFDSGFSYCDTSSTMSTFYDACRPIASNLSAPLNTVGFCTDSVASDCGLVNYLTGAPTTASAVRWIVNDPTAAFFYGTPFKGHGRNDVRGQTISAVNMSMFKNTKMSEKVTLQLRATAYNLFNHRFLGTPDPLILDLFTGDPSFPSFGTNAYNNSGGGTFAGSIVADGIAQRRLELGAKIIF